VVGLISTKVLMVVCNWVSGSRGLDPNQTSNFNTRQNGYDIAECVKDLSRKFTTLTLRQKP
jgi:hypothetical protein